ncbi:MAG: helix-turn-helix domain-containing protein [Desulfovibrio sp.]|nr:helix-turn-helix domain-containing protein [Desulfovibrio sp.]
MEEDRPQAPAGWPPLIGLTVEEAAQALRVNPRAVREAIREGGLPAVKVGRGLRISAKALDDWIARGSRNAAREDEGHGAE